MNKATKSQAISDCRVNFGCFCLVWFTRCSFLFWCSLCSTWEPDWLPRFSTNTWNFATDCYDLPVGNLSRHWVCTLRAEAWYTTRLTMRFSLRIRSQPQQAIRIQSIRFQSSQLTPTFHWSSRTDLILYDFIIGEWMWFDVHSCRSQNCELSLNLNTPNNNVV